MSIYEHIRAHELTSFTPNTFSNARSINRTQEHTAQTQGNTQGNIITQYYPAIIPYDSASAISFKRFAELRCAPLCALRFVLLSLDRDVDALRSHPGYRTPCRLSETCIGRACGASPLGMRAVYETENWTPRGLAIVV